MNLGEIRLQKQNGPVFIDRVVKVTGPLRGLGRGEVFLHRVWHLRVTGKRQTGNAT